MSTLNRRSLLTSMAGGLCTALMTRNALAQLEIDITGGVVEPIPIAVSPLAGSDSETNDIGRKIAAVVSADLDSCGLFETIDQRAYIQNPDEMRLRPRLQDWRQINAEALISGQLSRSGADSISLEFRLWDVFADNQLQGVRYDTTLDNWRRIAHKIADVTYERLTGDSGYFDSRIFYVSQTGPATRRIKRIAVMDQDGANHRFLTNGNDLVLTPRVAPDGKRLAYLALRSPTARIVLKDLNTGRDAALGNFPGMTFSPRFAPDTNEMLITLAEDGNSDIYSFDPGSRRRTRLTRSPAIDTSPSYSPDGKRIVFNSDRGGSPQLYTMNRDGSGAQRISFGAGRYGSPTWSPRGDMIAFTKIKSRFFHIGVMEPDGANERLITRSFLDEGPSWSPNGRVIVFTRENPSTNRTRLYAIDVTGYNERELPTPVDASDPDWSPLNK